MSGQSTNPIVDEIWRLLRETQESLKRTSERQERFQADQQRFQQKVQADYEKAQAETKELKASQREAARQIMETDRQIQKVGGRFNQRWGALVESLVEGKLVRIFQERGIDITQTHTRSTAEWRQADGHIERREFDIIVANGTEAVVVEVKTTLTLQDVKEFLETIQDFKKYFTRFKSETVYGAVAYLSSESKAHIFAEREGLFVIRATGDSASLINQKSFKPKAFS